MSSAQGSTQGRCERSTPPCSACPPPSRPSVRAERDLRADDADLSEHGHDDRDTVEQFIRCRFEEAFGSRVNAFMPRLLSLREPHGPIRAALGVRNAHGPLFLEQYLDRAIELEIAARTGGSCERDSVVEVGQLSGTYPGAVRMMIDLLTRQLHREGVRWVAFTGTSSLRNAFHRMGLSPIEIALAKRDRLPLSERAAWGRYYDDAPRVFFGNVHEGHRQLTSRRPDAAHP